MMQGETIEMSHKRVSIVLSAPDLASRVLVHRRVACSRSAAGRLHLPGAALRRRATRPATNASSHHNRGRHRRRPDSARRIPGGNHAGIARMKSMSSTGAQSLLAGGNRAISA